MDKVEQDEKDATASVCAWGCTGALRALLTYT